MADLRPPLAPAFAAFGATALVAPLGGSPFSVVAVRVGPAAPRPGIEGEAEVFDTRPRFRFRRADVGTLPVGSVFTIADGPDAGAWTVERVDPLDPELVQVVAQEAA